MTCCDDRSCPVDDVPAAALASGVAGWRFDPCLEIHCNLDSGETDYLLTLVTTYP